MKRKKRNQHDTIKQLLALAVCVVAFFIVLFTYESHKEPSSETQFITSIADAAIVSGKDSEILPSIIIAQAILESEWGRSTLSTDANNYFGIKGSYEGASVEVATTEFYDDVEHDIYDVFKVYPSIEASMRDHALLLTTENYSSVRSATSYTEAAIALRNAGYATDPMYAEKLIDIIESYRLFIYDTQ
ncbi:glycoside hydrolase family 73 protein [Erysipelothrix sp. HDW6C]|uniref:glycoside hydrolase family 73 protein n=1 Tax=Erysipelothrix sp. HDW6C TaxID=2714930 RepID=UPI00140B10A6|nr:glycoside hydrolase family 73 protein [Erysipelothrix sp. HDW6C]QIK70611.1 glycoside hydrolase family 73 protein [Erysipelothrix sp. HDW6C]